MYLFLFVGSGADLAGQDEDTPQSSRKVIKPNICLFDSVSILDESNYL